MGKKKNAHAVILGRRGAKAQYDKMTPQERREKALRNIRKRWSRMSKEERAHATLPARTAWLKKAKVRRARLREQH